MSLSNSDTTNQTTKKLTLEPNETARIANLCGRLDEHLKQIESQLHLKIIYRGNKFQINGSQAQLRSQHIFWKIYTV